MNVNIMTIVGRLARKPELKTNFKTKAGEPGYRCFMRVAVTRLGDLGKKRAEQRTNFIPVVCWGKTAKNCAEHLDTGGEVSITGEFIAESFVKNDAEGNPILDGEGKKQYNEYQHLQASSVQFGAKSMKNKNAEGAEVAADVTGTPAGEPAADVPASTPATVDAAGENPFDAEADAATA